MSRDRTVYRSEAGRVCPHCGLPTKKCACRANPRGARPNPGDGIVRVRRELKGRRGKTVSTVSGVPLAPDELRELAGELKRRCGSGGSVVEGVIVVQGDHVTALIEALELRGYRVKRSGG